MKVLNAHDVHHVSGGDTSVVITVNVPAAEVNVLAGLVGQLITDQLTPTTLADMLNSNVSGFNDMPVESITINKFTITRAV